MKIAALIARLLLGLVFTVFGLNGFIGFFPTPPLPPGPAGQFLGALFVSHYVYVVAAGPGSPGGLLLVNPPGPLSRVAPGPLVVYILSLPIFICPSGPS